MGVLIIWQKIYKTFAALRTGIILLILTGIASAVGTFILQRPTTEPEVMVRTYSPTALLWLDRLGLTDVYHTAWFTILLVLVCLSIIFASLERFPNAWRFYARPYRRPESHFRAVLPHHTAIPIADAKRGLDAAERAFKNLSLKPERIVDNSEVSLYSERHRFSVLAAYVIHASLLLIFAGWLIDYNVGYRGYLPIVEGDTANSFDIRKTNGSITKTLPFSIRCDETGQENYPDGTPRKWWSKLVVIENGKEIKSKTIVVNGPLDYRGIRFYQAGFGASGKLKTLELLVAGKDGLQRTITLDRAGNPVEIAPNTTVRLTRFVPDFYVQDNEVFTRSERPDNPAMELTVSGSGQEVKTWLMPRFSRIATEPSLPFTFTFSDAVLANYTGLEVSYQPGQWGVWIGTVLMAFGLFVAFFMVHMRFWAIAVKDEKSGQLVLWVGGAFNKNRERFEERYNALVAAIKRELGNEIQDEPSTTDRKGQRETTLAGV